MSKRAVHQALIGIYVLGLIARAFALTWAPPTHPDQFFQYLEPAWWRLTGAGMETWEWRDGVRSWVLPGYQGAWMALLLRLGVRSGAVMGRLLEGQWALMSMVLVGAGFRGGCLLTRQLAGAGSAKDRAQPSHHDMPRPGFEGGLLGALLCAVFPLVVTLSVQTLSEVASLFCLVWAIVLTGELVEDGDRAPRSRAVLAGMLLGAGTCLRIQHGGVGLVLVVWLSLERRAKPLAFLLAGAAIAVSFFGLVDRLTWGGFFSSFAAYLKFNVLGAGSHINDSPTFWYWHLFRQRLPWAWPLLALPAVLGIRATAPFVISALVVVMSLSTQPFKLERFVILFWPLILIAAAGETGAFLARSSRASTIGSPRSYRARFGPALVLAGMVFVLLDGLRHVRGTEFHLAQARLDAQAWVGEQGDTTGLLNDEPMFTGGYVWFGRTFPQLPFSPHLLDNPIFSHVIVPRDSPALRAAEEARFTPVFRKGDFVVLHRASLPSAVAGSSAH